MRTWVIVAILAMSQTAAAAERVELDAAQLSRAGIVTRPVLEHSFGDQQRVVGQVVRTPGSTVNLKTMVAGRVERLEVAPGDQVRNGQLVASLHSHEMLAMQGELLRAAQRSKLAETRLEAGRELFAVDGISRIDLEVREQEAFSAQLEFDTTYHELVDHGLPETALDAVLESRKPDAHLPIISPTDGVVLELGVQIEEWIQEYASVVVIGDPKRVELELQIAPALAEKVSVGDLVEFVPVGRPEEIGRATVITRVPQVDPDTRTIRIRARIVEQGAGLFPGAFVEGMLTQGTARMAPSVPESAVIGMGGGDVVFVALGPGVFEKRDVELGLSNGSRHEVVSGVSLGEEVVVKGVFFLKSALMKSPGEDG